MTVLQNAIVLVVDDDNEYREIHERRLNNRVKKLVIVQNYNDALEQLQRQFFHVAVLDIRLVDSQEENVEGLRLAEALYNRNEGTGIVIVSGYGTTDRSREAFRKYKAVDFLEKLIYTPQQFLDALNDAVIDSMSYVEKLRHELSPESFISHQFLDMFKSKLDYKQTKSFEQVFGYLVRPLMPAIIAPGKHQSLDEGLLTIRCWSRFHGQAFVTIFGLRKQVLSRLEAYRKTGASEDDVYTMGSVSGFRYIDQISTPTDFI